MGGFATASRNSVCVVGVGWRSLLTMNESVHERTGRCFNGVDNHSGPPKHRAALHRSMVGLLSATRNTRRGTEQPPAGVAHMFGVFLIEEWHMARGGAKKAAPGTAAGMPRFVDVRLTAEDRNTFVGLSYTDTDLIQFLSDVTDSGYRVGCSWSGEHQSYTVSLTGREGSGVNEGLCMTSFAGTLPRAVALAAFKHTVVTAGVWLSTEEADVGAFG